MLGIERQIISACHSISIGFDLVPVGRAAFEFPALTYFSERPSDRIPYLTLFPIGTRMRANLFAYREADDPWLREMRHKPVETMNAALPRLRRITGEFNVAGDVKIRPADLYVSTGYRQPGIVLVGDAFATTCPVPGTGTDKVFTDVDAALQRPYPGLACDRRHGRGQDRGVLRRSGQDRPATPGRRRRRSASATVSMDRGIYWRAQRWARFLAWLGEGCDCGGMRDAPRRGDTEPRSLLVVVILVIVVFIVIVGLTGRVDAAVALVVPELAIGAVGGEQLAHASRARSPCRLRSR